MARAVLRSRLRLRGHAALARAAGRPDAGRAAAHGLPAARGVVGVDQHHLDGELVRPGRGAGAPGADRRDAREPADGGRGAARVHQRRDAVRGAYVALQVGRNLFNVAVTERDSEYGPSFRRLLAWSIASAPLWIAGGIAGRQRARRGLDRGAGRWTTPRRSLRYWTPGLGSSKFEEWTIEGAHFAERFQLFIIIALGESIVVTGATASDAGADASTVVALTVCFLGSAALWWLYFDRIAGYAQERLANAGDEVGQLGRDAYTYLHVPIVAGIVLAAVGDELVIAHPGHHAGAVRRRSRSSAARPCTSSGTCCSGSGWSSARASRGRRAGRSLVATDVAGALIGLPLVVLAIATTLVLVALLVYDARRRRSPSSSRRRRMPPVTTPPRLVLVLSENWTLVVAARPRRPRPHGRRGRGGRHRHRDALRARRDGPVVGRRRHHGQSARLRGARQPGPGDAVARLDRAGERDRRRHLDASGSRWPP